MLPITWVLGPHFPEAYSLEETVTRLSLKIFDGAKFESLNLCFNFFRSSLEAFRLFTSAMEYFISPSTHLIPMHYFSTLWKHQKTLRFFDVFQGVEKGWIGNKWVKVLNITPNWLPTSQATESKLCTYDLKKYKKQLPSIMVFDICNFDLFQTIFSKFKAAWHVVAF